MKIPHVATVWLSVLLGTYGALRAADKPAVRAPERSNLSYNLEFATYLGGSDGELFRDMTVDGQGNIYVAGSTASANFPRTPGVVPGQSAGAGAMVAKSSPAGKLIWSKVFARDYF